MRFEELVATQVLQISIVVLIVWVTTQTITRRQTHLSYTLWLVVLLKCVTPPIWSSPVGAFSWTLAEKVDVADARGQHSNSELADLLNSTDAQDSRLHELITVHHVRLPAEQADADVAFEVLGPKNSLGAEDRSEHGSPLLDAKSARPREGNDAPIAPKAIGYHADLKWWAVAWGTVGMAIFAWTIGRAIHCWRKLRSATIKDAELQTRVAHLCQRLGFRRAVRLVVTTQPVGPAVFGLFRPTVVVPQFITNRKGAEQMEPILAHELIHIRRGDLWVGLLRHTVRSLWWFHPLVWKASSATRRGAECCCDEEVIATLGISPGDYARELLSVLEMKSRLKAVPAVPGVRPFDITSQRLERVMSLGQRSRVRTPHWCWGLALIFGILVLPGAGLMRGQDEVPETVDQVDRLLNDARVEQPANVRALPSVTDDQVTGSQVHLACTFFSGSSSSMDDLHVNWSVVASSQPEDRAGKSSATAKDRAGSDWGASHFVVRKDFPILYALLDDKEAADVFAGAKRHGGIELRSRPDLLTKDEVEANVFAGKVQRFRIGTGDQGEAKLRPVHAGLTARFLPRISNEGVLLRYWLTTTSVRSVEEMRVRSAEHKQLTIEIPEIASSVVSGVNSIPDGKTLLVRVQTGEKDSQTDVTLAMVKPATIHSEVAPSPPSPQNVASREVQSLPWGLLQKERAGGHIIAPGDVLGVYIVGVLGPEDQVPPIHEHENLPPATGFPIPVREDGTIPLPIIEDPKVAGLTISEAEALIRKSYTSDRKILDEAQTILVSLIRPLHVRVLMFRRDGVASDSQPSESAGPSAPRLNGGFELDLPATEADLLTALAKTGGLPGPEVEELLVYSKDSPSTARHIPLRFPSGSAPNLTSDDVTLRDGDIVVVRPAATRQITQPTKPGDETTEPHSAGQSPNSDAVTELERTNAGTGASNPPVSLATPETWKLGLQECFDLAFDNAHNRRKLGIRLQVPQDDGEARRNRGVAITTGPPKKLSRLNSDIPQHDVEINVRNFVFEISQAYWELYFCYRNLDATRTGFDNTHATWKQTATRRQMGLEGGEATNEAQARAQYFTFKARVEQAKSDLVHQENRLRYLLGIKATDGRLIQPIDQPTKARIEFDWNEIKQQAVRESPELREAQLAFKQHEQKLLAGREQLLPKIDAAALYKYIGARTDDTKNDEREKYIHEYLDRGEWQLGFDYSAPIGFRNEMARVRSLRLKLEQSEKKLEDMELALVHQLTMAVRRLRDQYRIAQTQYNSVMAFRDQLKAAEQAYSIAQSVPLDVVLDAQSRQAQAEVDYFRAITQYNLAIAEVHYRKGSLLKTLGFEWRRQAKQPDVDAALRPFPKRRPRPWGAQNPLRRDQHQKPTETS